ncbi:DUF4382 domain-containing protein [Haloarcula salina]|uniref:DUF4382 domain-containing protein n=1 Tax=Haloarcula salina TaxID=1429914 RepID=A0AA41KFW3_9EURY|nr:DUF4382 domain-containing protein [Haloarcula salina]MBV0902427.1 DUF4382 domain-containing protein [Haloarcula salina]
MRRRRFLASSVGVGVGLLAGCSGSNTDGAGEAGGDGTSGDGTATDEAETTSSDAVGSFRLLISDRPAAIGDFDSLNVSFSKTRIFRAGDGATATDEADATETETQAGTADATSETETATETGTHESTDAAATETPEPSETPEPTETPESEDGDDGGFVVRDLGGATVDLTEVVGEKAIGVLDGELSAGRYSKIELYAASVEGIVDGEAVDVKLPSGKLQLTKPFEVVADESVSFVFDINVVKKGNGGYNLLPVISESGVAGEDVTVEEVGDGESGAAASETATAETAEEDATEQESESESAAESGTGQSGTRTATGNGGQNGQ